MKTALCLGDLAPGRAAAFGLRRAGRQRIFRRAAVYPRAERLFTNTQTSMITTARAAAYLGAWR